MNPILGISNARFRKNRGAVRSRIKQFSKKFLLLNSSHNNKSEKWTRGASLVTHENIELYDYLDQFF